MAGVHGRGRTEEPRNLLMLEYLPMVKYNAERIYSKLPDEVELDDLMQAGIFGLKDAIESFDLERGVKFETYARHAHTAAPSWTNCVLHGLGAAVGAQPFAQARPDHQAVGDGTGPHAIRG